MKMEILKPILFVLTAATFCGEAHAEQCSQILNPRCLSTLGAGSVSSRADKLVCDEQIQAYRDCLYRFVEGVEPEEVQTTGGSQSAACSAEDARQLWPSLEDSNNLADLDLFAQFCGGTVQGRLAANRADRLRSASPGSADPIQPTPQIASRASVRYRAFISENDLYNSSGTRITDAAAIVQQDRANFHRFAKADQGDEADAFFGAAEQRQRLSELLRGAISPDVEEKIRRGGLFISVELSIQSDTLVGARVATD